MRPEDEILKFMTSNPSLEEIVSFQPSKSFRDRIGELILASRSDELTEAEQRELEEYTRIQHFLAGLKRRAQKRLAHKH
jgi:hypothetical protein